LVEIVILANMATEEADGQITASFLPDGSSSTMQEKDFISTPHFCRTRGYPTAHSEAWAR
jgi:hypothetical protein